MGLAEKERKERKRTFVFSSQAISNL